MKNKSTRTGLVAAVVLALFAGVAQATPGWFTCTVGVTGVGGNGDVIVRLSDKAGPPAFTNKAVKLPSNAEASNRMLAVMLMAIAMSKDVVVYLDPALGLPVVVDLYIQP